MAYISNKLCHFVGRSLKDDFERVNLLARIIRSGKLLANPKTPNEEPNSKIGSDYTQVDSLGEVFPHIDCVCFCDIPDEDLPIHTKKYGKVGLAFRKDFLVSAGARPVQYVPRTFNMQTQMKGCITSGTTERYFIEINRLNIYTLFLMDMLNIEENDLLKMYQEKKQSSALIRNAALNIEENLPELFSGTNLHSITYALLRHTMNANAYIKLFDPMLADDDPENYYMEREWRALNSVEFSVEDIVSVYLPYSEIMEDQFIRQFPTLQDRIIFLE